VNKTSANVVAGGCYLVWKEGVQPDSRYWCGIEIELLHEADAIDDRRRRDCGDEVVNPIAHGVELVYLRPRIKMASQVTLAKRGMDLKAPLRELSYDLVPEHPRASQH
jgi:hypothetical protein